MVVEDDPTLQFFYSQILVLNGFNLLGIADNGEEAILMYNSFIKKPGVILMDHRMPVKNGIETSKELFIINKKIIIIFISADESVKDEALSVGVQYFLSKPFTIEKLIDTIRRAVNYKEL